MKARKIAAVALIAGGVPLVSAPAWAHAGSGDKVTLCHRTDADNNRYVEITVDPDAVFKQGHDGHDGPVWGPGLKAQHTKWGDIIPPFDYTIKHGNKTSTGHYPGKNWTSQGQAIQANGCQVQQPASSPTPSSSSSAPSTPSHTPTKTPTRSPTASPSQSPSGSSTSSTSSSPTPTASTSVLPTSSTRPPTTPTEVPTTPPTPIPAPTSSPQPQPLPFTGSDTALLVVAGAGLIGAGSLLARTRKR